MISKIEEILEAMIDEALPRPKGTLAGHAGGLPFERLMHSALSDHFGERCYRHFESLNQILLNHPQATSAEDRRALFGPESMQQLVSRGKTALTKWAPDSQFVEKQDDTAETIIFSNENCDFASGEVWLVDVKTQNDVGNSQPPNIISASKLATSLRSAIQEGEVRFNFVYIGVSFHATEKELICKEVNTTSLFQVSKPLYINWSAAQQIQFHPMNVDQDFNGTKMEWAYKFIETFCDSLQNRIGKDQQRLTEFRAVLS